MRGSVTIRGSVTRLVVLAAMLAATQTLHAAEQNRFERLSDNLVLGQTSIQSFAQDQDGYLWLATQAGLKKFDGYRFESFRSDPDDPTTLSNRFVTRLLVDSSGDLWAATHGGLNRIDPESGSVTRIGLRLPDGELTWPPITNGALVEDVDGDIFAVAAGLEVIRWHSGSDAAVPVAVEGSLQPGSSSRLELDRKGRLWLAGINGLWRYERGSNSFRVVLDSGRTGANPRLAEDMIAVGPGNGVTYVNAEGVFIVDPDAEQPIRHLRPSEHGFANDRVHAVAVDSGNNLWLRLEDEIVRIAATWPQEWRRFPQPGFFGPSTNSNLSRLQLAETPDGNTWLAGRFGMARYDPRSDRLVHFHHDPNDPRSLPQTLGEIGYRIFLDDFGVLWVGANLGGLARLSPHSDRFVHVQDVEPSLISRNIVRAIAEHPAGDAALVWVANQNAGVSIWRRNAPHDYEIVHHYPPSFEDQASLGVVRSIAIQPGSGRAWLAGSHSLGRAETPGAPIELFALDPAAAPGLRSLRFLDSETLLASGSRGIWLVDVAAGDKPKVLQRFDVPAGIHVFDLLLLDDRRILAAGMHGLVEIDLESGQTRVHYPAGRPEQTPRNDVFHLARDREGRIWAGTRGAGLLRIDLDIAGGPVFEFHGAADGLPDDTIYAVLPDAAGSLWLSSNRGVIRYDPDGPDGRRVRQYTPADGLQAWEFNNTVAHIGASGRYYFGGINGWNVFRPGTVRDLLQPPRVHLESFSVNDVPTKVSDGRAPLVLEHDRNRVVIDFVGLQFADPERIRYAYRMDGVDEAWIEAGSSRQARYASLAPGRYRFQVKAANLDGVWSSPRQLLELEVSRPPWLAAWAWALYFACAGLLVLGLSWFQKRKRLQFQRLIDQRTSELREQNELVDRQARELEKALEARTLLFANVSHEFRTPLTLIRASIDELEHAPDPQAAAMGRKYLNRLLRMVEQLLDLSRLRLAPAAEQGSPWRLDSVVLQIAEAFRSAAEHQDIRVEDRINGVWHTHCPQNLVEKVLLNLIGNAVKFTPSGGSIKVSLQPAGDNAVICVEDTGPGISESDQAMVFRRFYRAPAADSNHVSGAGIGLALVAEAVRACGGSVDVTSRPGHGTCFWVTLPARRPAPGEVIRPPRVDLDRQRLDLDALHADRNVLDNPDPAPAPPVHAEVRGCVLVVEDNADLREYLARSLAPQWRVEQAADGNRGYERARASLPDLIVTDLMMPNVDGFEMLARLRADIETSHIPVLFLTARQDHETRLKAFTLSADAFLSKPFDLDELMARLDQMMHQRERLQRHLLERIGRTPGTTAGTASDDPVPEGKGDLAPGDRQLLENLDDWLKTHSSQVDIDMQAMADAMHVSPRTLQRKLKSLTGRSPVAYLRHYRLTRASLLLRESRDNVTDIAHACGFSSLQYFSRAFHEAYGAPPEKWRKHTASS